MPGATIPTSRSVESFINEKEQAIVSSKTVKCAETTIPLTKRTNLDEFPINKEVVIFSDFDGTIFMQDTGHVLFDNHGCGPTRREELDEQIKNGIRSFREVSEEMWGSLDVTLEDGFVAMEKALEIDSGFNEFHEYCLKNNVPFNVISAGLEPILRRVLDHWLGERQSKNIDIIANGAKFSNNGKAWAVEWRHDNELGHDKAASIQEYRQAASSEMDGSVPLVVFIGDGVSDLAAAREADILFARKGLRLEEYCIENNIPFVPYDSFLDIKRDLQRIIKENENREIREEEEKKEAKALKEERKPEPTVTATPVNSNFWDVTPKDKNVSTEVRSYSVCA
ncbi:hypothetical protein BJ508DRAFT_322629 [Ascobolus immersus RN42]|uniref:2,3-diketo-5-methylthio-1-phosphopentane phosphatase n=1 Tax=Ascobolus immersus RN42 TaxID=1160509 RepID=A0A3N4IID6_ASCIM|nr:hypothetical protein BJ508DRAFT_322629 [Ascobolus immersus RN42]